MSLVWDRTYMEEEIRISIYYNCTAFFDYIETLTELENLGILSREKYRTTVI